MINLIFSLLVSMGLVFLFFQHRNNLRQEDLIRTERKALKKLRKKNKLLLFQRQSSKVIAPEITPLMLKTLEPKITRSLPQVRNFEFPTQLRRKMEKSMVSN